MKRQFIFFAIWAFMAGIWLIYLLDAPFHEDEAIYAAWSLRISQSGGDFWLWETHVDKPPLTFYPMALSIALFGRHEWAARLPNLFWMLLLLASLWRIAKQRGASGWFAVGLTALSPLTWTYAASAFTDVAMVALAFVALERRLAGQAAQAGMAFGLALLAKPTALLLAPLIVIVVVTTSVVPRGPERLKSLLQALRTTEVVTTSLISFIMACAAPLLMAWAWDASRAAPSWWVLGAQAYGTLGSLSVNLISWARLLLIGLGPLFALGGVLQWRKPSGDGIQQSTIQLGLALTLLFWLPAHILLGFQPWERYLLPLVPLAALFLSDVAFQVSPNACSTPLLQSKLWTPSSISLNACSTFRLIDAAFYLSLLLVPALITPFQLEPHDGRWEGIADLGATIEELPPEAIVYYLDVGRPLAWYAADAEAKLYWVATSWQRLPLLLALSPSSPHYVILRSTVPLPSEVADWSLIKENSGFRLLMEDN